MVIMNKRLIIGLLVKVKFIGPLSEKEVIARVDTGAQSSSVDSSLAQKLGLVKTGNTKTIKSASGVGKRDVVRASIEVEGRRLDELFTIVDRTHMKYQALIGQDILKKEKFLIDPLL